MVNKSGGNTVPRIDRAEHIGPEDTGDNIEAKRVALYGFDYASNGWARLGVNSDGGLLGVEYISQFYSDATYTYICKANPNSALSDPVWQVKRLDSTGNKRYADGNANFTNAATDLVTVQGYSYS